MSNLEHSNIFYILKMKTDENGNREINYEPVQKAKTFKNTYGLDLFQHDGYISEGKSGLKVCKKYEFEDIVNKYGIAKIESLIDESIKKYGLSPRYTRPDETKDDIFGVEDKQYSEQEKSKLFKPLFVDGNFNREGKRIRAKYVKTVLCDDTTYSLWIDASSKPDKDYTRNENDKYYLYILFNDWLVNTGMTEYELEIRSSYDYMVKKWYGDHEGRNKYYEKLRNIKPYEESEKAVKARLAEEDTFCNEHCKDGNIQAILIKKNIDKAISNYINTRDNNGKFADFIGALFVGELDKCIEIRNKLKEESAKEEEIKRIEREERHKKEQEEKEQAERKAIEEAENILVNGGTIKSGELIVKIADKYGIKIPIRTRGWILNSLAECTISENGGVSYRYWKTKNATGSQKVYDVIFNIIKAIKDDKERQIA